MTTFPPFPSFMTQSHLLIPGMLRERPIVADAAPCPRGGIGKSMVLPGTGRGRTRVVPFRQQRNLFDTEFGVVTVECDSMPPMGGESTG